MNYTSQELHVIICPRLVQTGNWDFQFWNTCSSCRSVELKTQNDSVPQSQLVVYLVIPKVKDMTFRIWLLICLLMLVSCYFLSVSICQNLLQVLLLIDSIWFWLHWPFTGCAGSSLQGVWFSCWAHGVCCPVACRILAPETRSRLLLRQNLTTRTTRES